MGNTQENTQEKRRKKDKLDQIIVSASYLKRKLSSGGSSSGFLFFKHHGILVRTDEDDIYVIEHEGIDKDVRTNNYEESEWESNHEWIQVNNRLTIREAERIGGKGKTYLECLTCIGTALKIEKALQGK